MTIILPSRRKGRPSKRVDDPKNIEYRALVYAFCCRILEIQSRLDFMVSSRGWCYLLEEHGLVKGQFDEAQRLINDCRKTGELPVDICLEDDARTAENLDIADAGVHLSIDEYISDELIYIEQARQRAIDSAGDDYFPYDFWYNQEYYLEMSVEKIDLRSLFGEICRRFYIPITNARGWPDINSRVRMMRRFTTMEGLGKQCVLLYCGDFDPKGLQISDSIRKMFRDLAGIQLRDSGRLNWNPDNLIIDRFGLNYDFIDGQGLTWIDNLITSSGMDLGNPRNAAERKEHNKAYIQDYISAYGIRKMEANALVARPEMGRQLCLDAISRYVDLGSPDRYNVICAEARQQIKDTINTRLSE